MTANQDSAQAPVNGHPMPQVPAITVAGPFHLEIRVGQASLTIAAPMPLPIALSARVESLVQTFEGLVTTASKEVMDPSATSAPEAASIGLPESNGKKSKRGGARNPVISAKIDELAKAGWLKSKTIPEMVTRLKEIGVVSADVNNVYQACLRKLQKTLIRSGTTAADSIFSSIDVAASADGPKA